MNKVIVKIALPCTIPMMNSIIKAVEKYEPRAIIDDRSDDKYLIISEKVEDE